MIDRTFTWDFEFGIPASLLKKELKNIFNDMKVTFDWDYGTRNFEALLLTEEEFAPLGLKYKKLSVYLYGKRSDGKLKTLKVDVKVYEPKTSGSATEVVDKFQSLLQKRIKKIAEDSKPKIRFVSPEENSVVTGKQKIEAIVKGMTVKKVHGRLDNKLIFEKTSNRVDYILDTTKYPDGIRELTITAEDEQGREIRYHSQFEISNTPPKLVVKGIKDGDVVSGTVGIGLESRGGKISEIDIKINGEDLHNKELTTSRTKVKKAYSWHTDRFKDGWHVVEFIIKSQNGHTTRETKRILTINPPSPERERPKRRFTPLLKGKFYQEVLETVKTLISPHYGGLLSVDEATRTLNQIFDFDKRITNRELIRAINHFANGSVRWLSSNLIEVVGDRKVADRWLKEEIMKFARERGEYGFNIDEVLSHLSTKKDKHEHHKMKTRYIRQRGKRCLEELREEGSIIYQKYPPRWYFSGERGEKQQRNDEEG